MHKVYVLESQKDGNWYIGCSADFEKRLKKHLAGHVRSTKHRLPLRLLHCENFDDKYEAFRMERFYKSAKGKRILKNKIRGGTS